MEQKILHFLLEVRDILVLYQIKWECSRVVKNWNSHFHHFCQLVCCRLLYALLRIEPANISRRAHKSFRRFVGSWLWTLAITVSLFDCMLIHTCSIWYIHVLDEKKLSSKSHLSTFLDCHFHLLRILVRHFREEIADAITRLSRWSWIANGALKLCY